MSEREYPKDDECEYYTIDIDPGMSPEEAINTSLREMMRVPAKQKIVIMLHGPHRIMAIRPDDDPLELLKEYRRQLNALTERNLISATAPACRNAAIKTLLEEDFILRRRLGIKSAVTIPPSVDIGRLVRIAIARRDPFDSDLRTDVERAIQLHATVADILDAPIESSANHDNEQAAPVTEDTPASRKTTPSGRKAHLTDNSRTPGRS